MRAVRIVVIVAVVLTACGTAAPRSVRSSTSVASTTVPEPPPSPDAVASIIDSRGLTVGQAAFFDEGNKTRVEWKVAGLPPGFHGFHLHEKGRCDPPDFTTAGARARLPGQVHPDLLGDQPDLLANYDGTSAGSFETDRYHVTDIEDGDGSALVVELAPDAFGREITETASVRLACGVVKKEAPAPNPG